jgi:hypothetical protein
MAAIYYLEYAPGDNINAFSSNEGGYVKGLITYMVMDYLEVKPMSTISSITLLTKFNVVVMQNTHYNFHYNFQIHFQN